METVYENAEYLKSTESTASQIQKGPMMSNRRFRTLFFICLGLHSVFLLAGLIGLGVTYHDSYQRLSAHLTERLQAIDNNISFLTKERDLLNVTVTEMTKELERLQILSKENQTCPVGWRLFSSSCYLLSSKSGTWDEARQDCRDRGADLIVIHSQKVQELIFGLIQNAAWIGLTDREEEGTWKWVDGTAPTFLNWRENQPDNGAGHLGEEDCVHVSLNGLWNDLACTSSLSWICEKHVTSG
ncbi:uncharacterized protein V6R79_023649 [Siganus canaliculatus]